MHSLSIATCWKQKSVSQNVPVITYLLYCINVQRHRARKVAYFYILSNLEILFREIYDYRQWAFLVCQSKRVINKGHMGQ